jgi:hypothetical protein
MLSHPLPIIALVGHYPTNKLVGRSLLLGRNHTFDPGMLSGITHSFPWLFRTLGHITTRYSPFRRCPGSKASFRTLLARLACLIHAANVHSEPESNPSIGYIHQLLTDGSGEAKEPFEVLEVKLSAEADSQPIWSCDWLSRSRLQRTTP